MSSPRMYARLITARGRTSSRTERTDWRSVTSTRPVRSSPGATSKPGASHPARASAARVARPMKPPAPRTATLSGIFWGTPPDPLGPHPGADEAGDLRDRRAGVEDRVHAGLL